MVRQGSQVRTVYDLVRQEFGVESIEIDDVPVDSTMTTTVSQIVRANPARVALLLVNLGANAVMVWLDEGVSLTRGIRIGPNGGSMLLAVSTDFTLPARAWYGRTISSTSDITSLELKIG